MAGEPVTARSTHRSLPAALGVLAAFLIGAATLVGCGAGGSPGPGGIVPAGDSTGIVVAPSSVGTATSDDMSMAMTAPMTTTTTAPSTTTAAPAMAPAQTTVRLPAKTAAPSKAPVRKKSTVWKPPTRTKAPVKAKPKPPVTKAPVKSSCGGEYYLNSSGQCVHRPEQSPTAPGGASAQCKDGTYSFSKHRSGTCSGHGGVLRWL
jgi:hypothetical protein